MISPRKFAVLGNPVKHSLSPRLHALFAQQTGLNIQYEKHCVEPDAFSHTVAQFFEDGGVGLNITLPFKADAFALAGSRVSDRAKAAGSANTLWLEDGLVHACNTDGIGLVNDLLRLQLPLQGSRILLIGAGGATRGVMLPLLQAGCAHLHIVNRTEVKAHALAELARPLASPNVHVSASGFASLDGTWDIIVNASASSLAGEALPLPDTLFGPDNIAYDMLYTRNADTPFLRQARRAGVGQTSDGLGMLVYQGAESFRIWNHVQPEPVPVLTTLRTELAESA